MTYKVSSVTLTLYSLSSVNDLVSRLHREALKQAAVDPSTGKIDVSILTTGVSGAVRKQRADRATTLLEIIKAKGKVLVLKYSKLYEEFREKVIEKGEQVSCLLCSDVYTRW